MYNYAGWIVEALAGREKGKLFCVVGVERDTARLLLADGKGRKTRSPKRKKLSHVRCLTDHTHQFPHPVTQKLQRGEPVTDRELRRALGAFKEEMRLGKR